MSACELALGVELHQAVGDFAERFGDARLGARPIGAAHFGKARALPFGRRVLRDLMHLRHGHEHPVAAGVFEIEIVLRRAENRFGAQTEILADPVDGVHDVIADAQIGQRDRYAFLDGAHVHALGRGAVDFAVAEHAQAQAGNAESGVDAAGAHNRRAAAQAFADWNAGGAQDVGRTPDRGADDRNRLARGDRIAHAAREEFDLAVEVFGGTALENERIERLRRPTRRGPVLDRPRDDERGMASDRLAEFAERRRCGSDVSEQRFADVVLVDRQFARLDRREQDVLLARALFVECGRDR